MPSQNVPEILFSALTVVAAGALIGAGLTKVRRPAAFGSQIAAYAIVPDRAARALGHLLPSIELGGGTLLLLVPRIGGAVAGVLYLAFAAAVGINLARGRRELLCGCFGPRGKTRIGAAHVAGNVLAAAVALLAATRGRAPGAAEAMLGVSLALSVVTLRLIVSLRRMIEEVQPRAGA